MYISKRKKPAEYPKSSDIEKSEIVEAAEIIASDNEAENGAENGESSSVLELEREIYLTEKSTPKDTGITRADSNEADRTDTQDEDAEAFDPAKDRVEVEDDPQVLDGEGVADTVSYEDFLSENTAEGWLRITADAGTPSIPLGNVLVTVYKDFTDGRHVFYRVATNSDGMTERMLLPAPPRENSVDGNGRPPYSSYTVTAEREGLRGERVENVPVFAGVGSVQPIVLTDNSSEV